MIYSERQDSLCSNLRVRRYVYVTLISMPMVTFALFWFPLICGCMWTEAKTEDPFERSLALIGEHKYEEAIHSLKSAAPENNWKTYHYLGICYEKMGRRSKAIDLYAEAISKHANYRPYFRLGILYIEMGEYAKALVMLRKVKRLNPDFIKGRFYLAQAAFISNRLKESISNFRYILDREEYNPGSLAGMGILKYHQGNSDQAIQFLMRSIGYAPRWVWGRYQLGMIYMRTGSLKKAEQQFRVALQYEPGDVNVRFHLALTLEKMGKQDEAESLYADLLSSKEESRNLTLIKASIRMKKEQYSQAEDMLQGLLRQRDDSFETYKRLGYIYAVTGRTERAIECYREALKSRQDNIQVRYHYAVLCRSAGREKEAEAQFDRILKINPLSSEDYFLQGIIYGRRGDLDKAETFLKTAIGLNKFNGQGREILIGLLIQNNKLLEAAAIAEEILAYSPENRSIKSLLAQVWLKLGRYRRAEEILDEIIRWDRPDTQDIMHIQYLYLVYRKTNRFREAGLLKQKMLKLGIPLPADNEGVF